MEKLLGFYNAQALEEAVCYDCLKNIPSGREYELKVYDNDEREARLVDLCNRCYTKRPDCEKYEREAFGEYY